jgi:trans-2,3-dihydro-3-hydroxyanthranilate isomerase
MPPETIIPVLASWEGPARLHHYYRCDVFTAVPLQGNQLAVFVDGRLLGSETMQLIAHEMNLAETVFLLPPAAGGDVAMRIFTPRSELPFAGHPVLGTAFVVATAVGADRVTLETGAGLVPVDLQRRGRQVVFGRMQQPVPSWSAYPHPAELLEALGVQGSVLPVEQYRNGPPHTYVALDSPEAVAALDPDLSALTALGVAAHCFAGEGRTWKTRMFFPAAGVPEDSATGSAAGPLAVHLARHGRISYGDEIEITQGVEIGRPSVLYATARGRGDRVDSVAVGGAAVIVGDGRHIAGGA